MGAIIIESDGKSRCKANSKKGAGGKEEQLEGSPNCSKGKFMHQNQEYRIDILTYEIKRKWDRLPNRGQKNNQGANCNQFSRCPD